MGLWMQRLKRQHKEGGGGPQQHNPGHTGSCQRRGSRRLCRLLCHPHADRQQDSGRHKASVTVCWASRDVRFRITVSYPI